MATKELEAPVPVNEISEEAAYHKRRYILTEQRANNAARYLALAQAEIDAIRTNAREEAKSA